MEHLSIEKYITGQYALNIHHADIEDEPTGDWHGFIWDNIKELPHKDVTYAGKGCFIDTFNIWGNFGIYDDTKHLMENFILKEDTYVADYYRAILDMIYSSLKKYGKIYHLNCITHDHLDNEHQVMLVINKLQLLEKHLNSKENDELKRWVDNELNYENNRAGIYA